MKGCIQPCLWFSSVSTKIEKGAKELKLYAIVTIDPEFKLSKKENEY